MTNERKNEIWAMLTDEERADIINEFYSSEADRCFNIGFTNALMSIFGSHNLSSRNKG